MAENDLKVIVKAKELAGYRRLKMSKYDAMQYKGKSLMFWALEWFSMSNDGFHALYGFNFNPHEYPGLYEAARDLKFGR